MYAWHACGPFKAVRHGCAWEKVELVDTVTPTGKVKHNVSYGQDCKFPGSCNLTCDSKLRNLLSVLFRSTYVK